MAQLLAVLAIFVAAAELGGAGDVCKSENEEKLVPFNGKPELMSFPCKYWALKRQKCGPYRITLTPGIEWLAERYRLDTLWVGITNATTDEDMWKGRTTNKIAIKFMNSNATRDLFNKKGGPKTTSEMFYQNISKGGDDEGAGYMEDKAGNFRISFFPWHPRRSSSPQLKGYTHSKFRFECFKDETLNPYPDQMCGNEEKGVIANRSKHAPFSMSGNEDLAKRIVIYYDLFMNEDVTQMDGKCLEAVDTLKTTCTNDADRVLTLQNCEEILGVHTDCVTRYSCDPMDVFNACLKWGCNATEPFIKDKDNADCMETGEGIDLCPEFSSIFGNLTERMKSAKCYKEFFPIKH